MPERVLRPWMIAHRLSVSVKTVYRWLEAGTKFPVVDPAPWGGRGALESDVDGYIAALPRSGGVRGKAEGRGGRVRSLDDARAPERARGLAENQRVRQGRARSG